MKSQKLILLWCAKKPKKMQDVEPQCPLGTIRVVYDWDRDLNQLMSNQKPPTHYKMTGLLVIKFCTRRVGPGFFNSPSGIVQSAVSEKEGVGHTLSSRHFSNCLPPPPPLFPFLNDQSLSARLVSSVVYLKWTFYGRNTIYIYSFKRVNNIISAHFFFKAEILQIWML